MKTTIVSLFSSAVLVALFLGSVEFTPLAAEETSVTNGFTLKFTSNYVPIEEEFFQFSKNSVLTKHSQSELDIRRFFFFKKLSSIFNPKNEFDIPSEKWAKFLAANKDQMLFALCKLDESFESPAMGSYLKQFIVHESEELRANDLRAQNINKVKQVCSVSDAIILNGTILSNYIAKQNKDGGDIQKIAMVSKLSGSSALAIKVGSLAFPAGGLPGAILGAVIGFVAGIEISDLFAKEPGQEYFDKSKKARLVQSLDLPEGLIIFNPRNSFGKNKKTADALEALFLDLSHFVKINE